MNYDAENRQLLREYRTFKDSDLLWELYDLNKGLFYRVISKYKGLCDYEDLQQECYFALVKAAESYREELGLFCPFLAVVVSNHLRQYIYQSQLIRTPEYLSLILNIKSLDAPINEDSETTLGDTVGDPTEYQERVIDSVFCEEITNAIKGAELSDREKSFLFQRFYENKTYLEIDPEHNRNNTRNIIEKALRKLRKNDSLQKMYSETNVYICNGLS